MSEKLKSELKSISLLGLLTFVSRVLGLIRDILLAVLFGASSLLDAFIIAFTIPNLFRRLFGEGVLTSIFTPMFQKTIKDKGLEEARVFASHIFCFLVFFLSTCCFVIVVVCWGTIFLYDFSPGVDLTLKLAMLMLPYVVFICLVAYFASILNALYHFVTPYLAPIILNILWIVSLVFLLWLDIEKEKSLYIIAITIVVAGLFQVLSQIPILKHKKVLPSFVVPKNIQNIKLFLVLFCQSSVGVMIVQVNILADRIIAWGFIKEDGAVSVLYMGNRLMQFPLGIIGISIATVIFPLFTRYILEKDMLKLNTSLTKALHGTFLLSFPASIGLWLISEPLILLFYNYASFTKTDVLRTSWVTSIYSMAIWVFCLQYVMNKVFYAFEDVKTPMKISCISALVNVLLNFLFVGYMAEIGLAFATVCSAIFALGFSLYYLQKKLLVKLKISFSFVLKIILSCFFMGVVVNSMQNLVLGDSITDRMINTIVPILGAIITYFLSCWILGAVKTVSLKD